ncbi:MAG: hypothetical protein KF805_14455 [Phycisphaeraceae bacterium]|nr:hypothetical protein [Phycisphaeraceae bacterium]
MGNSEINSGADGVNNKPDIGMEGSKDFGGGITLKSAAMSMAMVLALGMLIWVKLRLVTNVPRTAYAEPERKMVEPEIAKQQTADATEKH